MQRDQSEMDMNGHRPQSPASAENAPSPSKRPRLEGGPMNGQQLAPNGRGQAQGMPGQPNPQALFMQNGGLNPRGMNPAQLQAFQQGPGAHQKSIQVYAQNLALHHSRSAMNNQGMPNGIMNPGVMPNQTDLMPMPEGQGMYPMNGDYYGANGQMAQVRAGMQTPGNQGNHALQDYQMQLMLLEQQNKRRLMMARQEQDSMARPDGQPPMPGQQQLPPGTSPQGSRAGASPNPNDQMKRGTPKMPQTGLPGSPNPGDVAQGRGSPASMNFNSAQMPPDMTNPFFAAPNGMRPPSSNPAFTTGPPMGQQIPAGAQMPNRAWQPQQGAQGQPMPPQQSPAAQPATGTPQERNQMPPPQAPPAAGPNSGRTQPPSPQTGAAAPPTPQQSNKAAPKGKKDTKDTNRKVRDPRSHHASLIVFIERDSSGRRRQLALQRLQLPRILPRPPRPRLSMRRRHRRRSRLSIRTRSTSRGPIPRRVRPSNPHRRLPHRRWCSRRHPTRTSRSMTLACQTYVFQFYAMSSNWH